MPFAGGGTTFSIINSFTPGTTILSSQVNANYTDIASGLTALAAGTQYVAKVELGNASDTTLSRSAAGVMAVEGGAGSVYVAGVELGNASDTTLSRSAAGTLAVEGGAGKAYVANVELGNASDTTLGRSAAGVMAVEGKALLGASYGSFFVGKTANQSVGGGSTLVTWSEAVTGGFDTTGEFASNVWTPTKAGLVTVSAGITLNSSSTADGVAVQIRKSTAVIAAGIGTPVAVPVAGNLSYITVSATCSVNGTTDTIDVVIFTVTGGSILYQVTGLGTTIPGSAWFTGRYC